LFDGACCPSSDEDESDDDIGVEGGVVGVFDATSVSPPQPVKKLTVPASTQTINHVENFDDIEMRLFDSTYEMVKRL
jgi:hypothetical protein